MTTRKALSAFLAFTILITSVLFAYPLGASAEGANRVTAQTDASVTQGNYAYCYVYIDDPSALASLSVSVYYDSDKIEVDDSYNQITCSVYDSSVTDECIQFTYLFEGEGSSTKTSLFYFRYRVKENAAIGQATFDIVINEAYDSALDVVSVSGSRTNFTVGQKREDLFCDIYGSSYAYSMINNEFTVSYMLSTNEIAAGSILIRYDSDLFEVVDVTLGNLLGNKSVDVNYFNGAILVSFSGTEYSWNSDFLDVSFKTIKNAETQSAITMTVIEFYDLDRNKINCSGITTTIFLLLDPTYKGDAPSMSVTTQYIEPGMVVATITLAKDSHLGAGDFVLKFDPMVLQLQSAIKGFEPDFFNVNDKNAAVGELKFSIISLTDITETTNVLVVIFNVMHNCAGTTTALQISGSETSDSLTKPITLNFCGANTVIPPANTYGDWRVDIAPKCESIGYESKFCTICNNMQIREIPALGHDMQPSSASAPTCTEPGVTAGTKCSRCDHTTATSIPALKHDLTQIPAKAATCTEIGWNAYEKCSRCAYTTYVEIPALKHDLIQIPAKAATCTEIGWNAYKKCSRCDYNTYVELPALKHDLTQIPAKAATCTEIGWNAYEKCSRCAYTTYVEIPAKGHDYTPVVTTPTCTEQGYTTYTCACGDSYVMDFVDARGYDWMLEDGEFKILLIGNSFSEDASNAGMPNSQMLDILQAMLGENVKVTVGLCYSGGKGLNWHASQSEQGNRSYSLRVISTETGAWKSYGSYTSADALKWTDWDVVSLQHYQINTTTGKESNAYPEQVDPKFDNLKSATEFMLDYVDQYAPRAAVYFYMHWASAYKSNLNESLAAYNKMAGFFPVVLDYMGPESANRFETIIPVGLSIQNARTTYLAALAYNTTAYADGNLNLNTDAQIGLQRDGGHLSYNIGRYIAALTFAEIIIPEEMRVDGYILPNIRITESVGELPYEYTEIAQKAVHAAVASWENGSLDITNIDGYTQDPTIAASQILKAMSLNLDCVDSDGLVEQIEVAVLSALSSGFAVDAVQMSDDKTTVGVTIRFGYTSKTVKIACAIADHVYIPAVTAPTCTEQGYITYTCACGDSYVDSYVSAKGHSYVDWIVTTASKCLTKGEERKNCANCDHFETREVAALGHNLTKYDAKVPNCTEVGWNAYEKCSRCSYTTYLEIPALKHDLAQIPAKAATCTEIGWNAYEKCSRCSYTTYVELPMSEHTYSSVVVKPQFGSQGYTQYTCSVCGHSYKDNYTDPLTYLPGDIDGSGAVDALDAETILKYITGHDVKVVEAALDVNGDGKVDIRDAATILLYLEGKNVELN